MKTKLALLWVGTLFILTLGVTAMAQPFLDCNDATWISCNETQTNETAPGEPGAGDVTIWCGYPGMTYEDADEYVYEFTLEEPAFVIIQMKYTHITGVNDLDMSVRSICDESECLAFSNGITGIEFMEVDLQAGTYFIGIDGYHGQQDGSSHVMSLYCDPVSTEATSWGDVKTRYR